MSSGCCWGYDRRFQCRELERKAAPRQKYARGWVVPEADSRQLVKQRLCFLQVQRVEALDVPIIDWRQEFTRFDPLALSLP